MPRTGLRAGHCGPACHDRAVSAETHCACFTSRFRGNASHPLLPLRECRRTVAYPESPYGQDYRAFLSCGYVDAVKIRPREPADQAAAQAFLARHNSLRGARLGNWFIPWTIRRLYWGAPEHRVCMVPCRLVGGALRANNSCFRGLRSLAADLGHPAPFQHAHHRIPAYRFAGCGSSCGLRSSIWPRPFRKKPKMMLMASAGT